ncbi:hypothetical protein TURU_058625 [Turdus rufiventris]|nr:hypothetical protein TURU_058625 [Turdus rufiventris]
MATLIGLSIKVKLLRSLPDRFKLDVHITPGTHASEHAAICYRQLLETGYDEMYSGQESALEINTGISQKLEEK